MSAVDLFGCASFHFSNRRPTERSCFLSRDHHFIFVLDGGVTDKQMHMYGDVAWFVLDSASGWVGFLNEPCFFPGVSTMGSRSMLDKWMQKKSWLYPRTGWWFAGFTGVIQISSRDFPPKTWGEMAANKLNLWGSTISDVITWGAFFLTDWGSLGWICLVFRWCFLRDSESHVPWKSPSNAPTFGRLFFGFTWIPLLSAIKDGQLVANPSFPCKDVHHQKKHVLIDPATINYKL